MNEQNLSEGETVDETIGEAQASLSVLPIFTVESKIVFQTTLRTDF